MKYDYNNKFNKTKNSSDKIVRHNYSIKNLYCRIIENGKALDIMRTSDAIAYAENLKQDLIEIGYDKVNNCSNCKLGDYSKYMYEMKKKEKTAKKLARVNTVDIKTVQMTLTTDVADRNRRELENIDLAKESMKDVMNQFNGIAVLDSNPSLNGKEMFCILRKS